MPMSSSCCIAMSITTSNPALKALLSYWYVSNVWGQWARCFFVLRVSTPGCLTLIKGRLPSSKARPIKILYDSLEVVMRSEERRVGKESRCRRLSQNETEEE